jgi:predicted SAM-dependent methyltransferase
MIKINIGCGETNFGEDWISIDGNINYRHVVHDDVHLSSHPDNSVDFIYSSHFIEYFDRGQVIFLLENWHKVLKPDGILRIAVPDFESMAKLYINGDFPLEKFLGPLYGKMEMGGKTIYHKTVYDIYTLRNLLEQVGFKNIHRYDWRNTEHSLIDDFSQAHLPHMDKENGTLISLNVECNK